MWGFFPSDIHWAIECWKGFNSTMSSQQRYAERGMVSLVLLLFWKRRGKTWQYRKRKRKKWSQKLCFVLIRCVHCLRSCWPRLCQHRSRCGQGKDGENETKLVREIELREIWCPWRCKESKMDPKCFQEPELFKGEPLGPVTWKQSVDANLHRHAVLTCCRPSTSQQIGKGRSRRHVSTSEFGPFQQFLPCWSRARSGQWAESREQWEQSSVVLSCAQLCSVVLSCAQFIFSAFAAPDDHFHLLPCRPVASLILRLSGISAQCYPIPCCAMSWNHMLCINLTVC